MKKKIVITGSNGFIGMYLTEFFEKHNFEVIKLFIHINLKQLIETLRHLYHFWIEKNFF